ncbi:MAG: fatty acid desaturase [Bdellovibrionales bacterium]|nr:fatty acid desaturase [Bdellovibrionales bacterium]
MSSTHSDSKSFFDMPKSEVLNNAGVRYLDFKKTLTPSYSRAWIDISVTILFGAVFSVLIASLQSEYPYLFFFTIPVGALLIGYQMATLQLFWHEASHYFLAPSRSWNDILANIFIGSWVGQDIDTYRRIHFDHHRFHGDTNDSEHSYFEPLTAKFIFESLVGIRVLRVLSSRGKHLEESSGRKNESSTMKHVMLAVGVFLNGAIVIGTLVLGYWQFSFTWVLAIGSGFPFFASLRQLLEHRSLEAHNEVNYKQVAHGAVNRMFGDGILASTFGAAGFNRHLLHHWDPSIPYTALPEVEKFLMDSAWASEIGATQTTYFRVFKELYQSP